MEVRMKDINRYKIITEWEEGRIKGGEVSLVLGLSYRQALRIRKRFKEEGIKGLFRKKRKDRRVISECKKEEIKELYKNIYGMRFNILHFKEKLKEVHNINLCYESIRKILIEGGLHTPKKKRRNFHKRRQRMPKEGMLVQMDSSYHRWLENITEKWYLISMIDDATNEVLAAKFFPKDTVFNNMEVIRKAIEKKGLFVALYVDKASHFKTTRYGGLYHNIEEEQEMTHIEKALNNLGTTLIFANSPQAKGRIERLFGFFQDRLINEMWLKKIKNYKEANDYLEKEFIPWYNKRYTYKAEGSVYSNPDEVDLDVVFTKRFIRHVKRDNTIRILGETFQLIPTGEKLNLQKAVVEVRVSSDNRMWIIYKGKIILQDKFADNNKMLKKEKEIEEILKHRATA